MTRLLHILKLSCLAVALMVLGSTFLSTSADARGRQAKTQKHGKAGKSSSRVKGRAVSNRRAEARRRRAEAARQAALARQRALDEAMRRRVQSMISRDDITGEDAQVRR